MSDYADLIHWLRTFPFNGQMTTDQIGEAAGKCLEASEAIHSLRASLANEQRAREECESRNVFLETEIVQLAERVKKS
jgi:hypothetical protein